MTKILVASPTYEGMKYCQDEFISRLKELTYQNYDILLVDNSEKDDSLILWFLKIKNQELKN